jgi:hypothetical protein
VDSSSDAVAWVVRELRFERWLEALASTVDRDGDGEPATEAVRRPA